MIRAAIGGNAYVAGKSIAIVATGPSPGNTPIKVPNTQPIKQYIKFCNVNAVSKPSDRLANNSIFYCLVNLVHEEGEKRECKSQSFYKRQIGKSNQEKRIKCGALPAKIMTD